MSENNFSDLFRQIERSVQDLASLGATELKHVIDETVREVRNTVNGTVEQYRSAQKKTTPPPSPSASYTRRYANVHQPDATAKVRRKISKQPPIPTTLAVHPSKVPGKISGTLMVGFATVVAISSGISLLKALVSFWTTGNFISAVLPILLLGGAAFLLGRGLYLRGRVERYALYYRELTGVTFCSVKALAQQLKKSTIFVAKDLQRMIDSAFFPEGHLDTNKTTFILDHTTYDHYLKLEERNAAQKVEQEKRAQNPELDAVIREGMVCIQKIKEANDAIQGEIISAKLFRLENIVTKIFEFMERHPERLGEIRRFTSYYLPTTLKLVAAYREFDTHNIHGETVQASKKEIEEALDSINTSFEMMFDSLFEDDARDLSADISVLHSMLRQEGWESDGISDASNK